VLDKYFDKERVVVRVTRSGGEYCKFDDEDVVRVEVITK